MQRSIMYVYWPHRQLLILLHEIAIQFITVFELRIYVFISLAQL